MDLLVLELIRYAGKCGEFELKNQEIIGCLNGNCTPWCSERDYLFEGDEGLGLVLGLRCFA